MSLFEKLGGLLGDEEQSNVQNESIGQCNLFGQCGRCGCNSCGCNSCGCNSCVVCRRGPTGPTGATGATEAWIYPQRPEGPETRGFHDYLEALHNRKEPLKASNAFRGFLSPRSL